MATVLIVSVTGGCTGSAVATSGAQTIDNQNKTTLRFIARHSHFIAKRLCKYGRGAKSYQPDVRIHP